MLRAAAVLAAILMALAACFTKPREPGGPDDGSVVAGDGADGAGDADASGSCSGPSDDMSPNVMVCGAWGAANVSGAATLSRVGGVLEAAVSSSGALAECVTNDTVDFTHGASVAVQDVVMGGSGDTTRFTATFTGGATISVQVAQPTGIPVVFGACSGAGGFSGPAGFSPSYRYWKLGIQNPTTVAAYYSANGTAWQSFGSCSVSGEDVTTATIRFGASGGMATGARVARFDDFRTCTTPP